MFKKKKPKSSLPYVTVTGKNGILYEGLLKDIPLKDSMIIEKSIHFFDDPEPCYIHRGAVRTRLTQELYQELESSSDTAPGPLMRSYADFEDITECHLQ
jgi:hypothetical protein